MRRRAVILVGVVALVMVLATTAVAGTVRTSRSPKRNEPGDKIEVTAKDCKDGPNWDAVIVIEIIERGDEGKPAAERKVYKRKTVDEVEPSGTTETRIRVPRNLDFRSYTLIIRCEHHFTDGTVGVWYEEDWKIKVVEDVDDD